MRFVPAVAALADGPVRFDGDPHARLRPMAPVLGALRTLGVDVDDDGRGGLPFTVHGRGSVRGGAVTLDASASSQFVSGLLLSGARFDEGVTVHHDGKAVPSLPHIEMTVETLRDAGVVVDDGERAHLAGRAERDQRPRRAGRARPVQRRPVPRRGAGHQRPVQVPGWPQYTTQGGDFVRDVLDMMGAEVVLDRAGLTVSGGDGISGVDVDLHDSSELTPVVAALCALADSPSVIRGVAHIRGHETDRLAALRTELTGLGAEVDETDDGLRITPRPLHGGTFRTYADHRMVMAAAVLGLVVPGLVVEDVGTVAKTLPEFTQLWDRMLSGRVTAGA